MAVIVNGRQFLDADDVFGNPALALAEANKQLAFAAAERLRRESEVRVDIDGNPDPNGGFINAGLETDLTTSIASQLPAVVVGSTAGVISRSGFIIDPSWPIDTGTPISPPIVQPPEGSRPPPDTDPFIPPPDNNPEPIDGGGPGGPGEPGEPGEPGGPGDPGGPGVPEPGAPDQLGPPQVDNFEGIGNQIGAPIDSPNPITPGGTAIGVGAGGGSTGLSPQVNEIVINPKPNQLSSYASHTYNIALYMLQPANYVKLLKNPTSIAQIPKQLLMRSGGIGNDGGDNFDVDFFIDNLQMRNIGVSPNNQTSNTNAVDIKFEITEPMGVTLVERLKTEAENSLEQDENYISTPYLLEITFKGYDDFGEEIVGAIKPKYVPIKITDLTFRVESTGTVYKVKAIPFHQDVFSSLVSTIPINIQVSAGTVKDIFGGTANTFKFEEEKILKGVEDELGRVNEELVSTGNKLLLLGSKSTLTDAINGFFEAQTKETTDKDGKKIASSAEIADKWSFNIAPEIERSKLVGSKFDALNTPQQTKKVYQQAAAGLKGQVTLDSKTNLFKVMAGTNIVSLINYIIVASEYVDKNIVAEAEKLGTEDAPQDNVCIKWFKIVPEIIDFIGWDNKQKRYKFSIQWTISVHGMFYSDFPWAPKSKPKGTGVHKIYDYIFSGNNTEITDLTLQFDNAYYNAHTIGTGVTKGDKEDKFNLTAKSKAIPPNKQGISNDETITKQRSKDLMTSLMYDGYDLIQLDLAILGDPAFLPIGDAFFQTQGNRNAVYDNAFLPDDTINYDLTPPYVQLNLKTPTDYNDLTGLVDLSGNGKYASSQFSGVYRVTETDSSFSGGMFTQRLSGFREKAQPINGKVGGYGRSTKIRKDSPSALDDSIASGINPAPSLLSQGSAVLSTVGESRITGFQARRIQRLADEADQGRFEEGIGDEEPPVELTDNNNIVSVDQFTELLKD